LKYALFRRELSSFYNNYELIPLGYLATSKIIIIASCVILGLGELYRPVCQQSLYSFPQEYRLAFINNKRRLLYNMDC
jgi:hypothetical protein